jgi:hypothetical protein
VDKDEFNAPAKQHVGQEGAEKQETRSKKRKFSHRYSQMIKQKLSKR